MDSIEDLAKAALRRAANTLPAVVVEQDGFVGRGTCEACGLEVVALPLWRVRPRQPDGTLARGVQVARCHAHKPGPST